MAIKMISSEWCGCLDDYRKEFVMDSKSDLVDLPKCCAGSSAIAVNDGAVYMVNASGEWVAFGTEG